MSDDECKKKIDCDEIEAKRAKRTDPFQLQTNKCIVYMLKSSLPIEQEEAEEMNHALNMCRECYQHFVELLGSLKSRMDYLTSAKMCDYFCDSIGLDESVAADDACCRFIGWRKIDPTTTGIDFLSTLDSTDADYDIWQLPANMSRSDHLNSIRRDLAQINKRPAEMSDAQLIEAFRTYNAQIFRFIAEPFEQMINEERKFRADSTSSLWKRQVSTMREMCDICNTTLFNGHFVCKACGFAVCFDCYRERAEAKKSDADALTGRDGYNWFYCKQLKVRDVRSLLKLLVDGQKSNEEEVRRFVKTSMKSIGNRVSHEPNNLDYVQFIPPIVLDRLNHEFEQLKLSTIMMMMDKEEKRKNEKKKSFTSEFGTGSAKFLVLDTSIDSFELQSEPNKDKEIQIDQMLFEEFNASWPNKKPVLIRNLHKRLDMNIWRPEAFNKEFGDLVVNLVNCRNHRLVANIKMEVFWNGFDNEDERLCDTKGEPMILKLKDWPNSEDFKNILPTRYEDLMKNSPIKPYTSREGLFNMASSLHDHFLKPDLGPKMYIAYSSAKIKKEGTTNLHVDISDAFNLMIHVSSDLKCEANEKIDPVTVSLLKSSQLYKLLKSSKCDDEQVNRFLNGELPGALWHLFHPKDADTIRTFLVAVSTLFLFRSWS